MNSQFSESGNSNPSDANARPVSSEQWGPWSGTESSSPIPQPPASNSPSILPAANNSYPAYPSVSPMIHYPNSGSLSPGPYSYAGPQTQNAPYPPAYPGYPPPPAGYPYAYAWPAPPKRDTYLFVLAIITVVGASLLLLIGLLAVVVIIITVSRSSLFVGGPSAYFAGLVGFTAFAVAGLAGGISGLYYSIRSLLKTSSPPFSIPEFWIFLAVYALVITAGFVLQSNDSAVAFPPLSIFLIFLAAVCPAFVLVALGVRGIRNRDAPSVLTRWATTRRRFIVALISGATLAIGLSALLELLLVAVVAALQGVATPGNASTCIVQFDDPSCQNAQTLNLLIILAVIIAPFIEELVKPVAVIALIGRIGSATEAFVLGLACGVGFDLIETVGYLGLGYKDWLNNALLRSGTGLLHGFGAAMVALGWYYLTHAKKHRLLLALGCWLYAVLQHAIWNGSQVLGTLPDPVGSFVNNWSLNLGFVTLSFPTVLTSIEALCFLAFFLYVVRKLRTGEKPSITAQA